MENNQQTPPVIKPDSNLVWGILTTLFCCLPFGIVSIVYAAKVDSLWYSGLYQEAYSASRTARNWALAAAITSLAVVVIYIVVVMVIAASVATAPLYYY